MNIVLNKAKSKIRVKRNTLRMDSVHVDVELWGSLSKPSDGSQSFANLAKSIKLLVFGPSEKGGVFLGYATVKGTPTEIITDEEFSTIIWQLPIVADDEIQLSKEDADKVYEQVVRSKKMFLAATGLTLS